jgi:hypothetical protein
MFSSRRWMIPAITLACQTTPVFADVLTDWNEKTVAFVTPRMVNSPTAPGATHRWTYIRIHADEVAHGRIWAGFHYRFSVNVGREMGRKIGEYVVSNAMQPASVATTR